MTVENNPLMSMAGVCSLDRDGLGSGLVHQIKNIGQLYVMMVWSGIVPPAQMKAH